MKPVDPSHPVHERRGYLYGNATTRRAGGIEHASKFGTGLVMRSAAPPPVAAYDAYLSSSNTRNARNVRILHGTMKTGFRLRRIVVMRRAGSSWQQCGEAVGISAASARGWVEFLPHELGV
jgi:hypothetical protein